MKRINGCLWALFTNALGRAISYTDSVGRFDWRGWSRDMAGAVSTGNAVEVLVLVFVAIVVIYQLIPMVSNSNVTVQASDNVTSMGKFAAGLGEWLFPLLGIIAIVFLLWRKSSGKKS